MSLLVRWTRRALLLFLLSVPALAAPAPKTVRLLTIGNSFLPKGISAEDAAWLQGIAHRAVLAAEGGN